MTGRDITLLILIVVLTGLAVYVVLDVDHAAWFENLLFWRPEGGRDIQIRRGLDMQGGLQLLLAADVPAGQEVDPAAVETARQIIENRVNGLGLSEPVVQRQGDRRIIVELPGIEDHTQAVETIQGTALLEWIAVGPSWLPDGTLVRTTLGGPTDELSPEPTPASDELPTVSPTPTAPLTPTTELTATLPITSPLADSTVYETIVTGAGLETVELRRDDWGYFIVFELYPEATEAFAAHTAAHQGEYLCIVLDKEVISCPQIEEAIPSGMGRITLGGNATYEEARSLEVLLRYGALPVPLRLETINNVGPTLGEISVERSIRAGVVGLSVVLLFMLVYYRLPGSLAALALVIYALLNLAVYKLLPVTLTLPGIAGFLLSAGMAVDANILVFERMKEELRSGRMLVRAAEDGFRRAWTSIRDSQISTLIVCVVLYFFGTNFGASMVRGFAVTLAIGTLINLFTAVVATRSFIRLVFHVWGRGLASRRWLLGV